jgi:hypothetical protein
MRASGLLVREIAAHFGVSIASASHYTKDVKLVEPSEPSEPGLPEPPPLASYRPLAAQLCGCASPLIDGASCLWCGKLRP